MNLAYIEVIREITEEHKPRIVIVEAGHIYMDKEPDKEHEVAAEIAARISASLAKHGHVVIKQLFVDNYNPNPENFSLDVKSYVDFLESKGFKPDIVTYESWLETPAKNLLAALKTHHDKEGGNIFLADDSGIKLQVEDRPTCSLLDSALYIAKLSMCEMTITVLPRKYKAQQKSVFSILSRLGYARPLIINALFDVKEKGHKVQIYTPFQ